MAPRRDRHQAALIAAAALALLASIAAAEDLSGVVTAVHDGDTLTLREDSGRIRKVRLAAIDAPELRQAFGRAAQRYLARRVEGRRVAVTTRGTSHGRAVGVVIYRRRDLGLRQIEAGYAWYDARYRSTIAAADREIYAAAQKKARDGRRGLWQAAAPVAPWEWRGPQPDVFNRNSSKNAGCIRRLPASHSCQPRRVQ